MSIAAAAIVSRHRRKPGQLQAARLDLDGDRLSIKFFAEHGGNAGIGMIANFGQLADLTAVVGERETDVGPAQREPLEHFFAVAEFSQLGLKKLTSRRSIEV